MRLTLLIVLSFIHCFAQAGTLTVRVVRITDGDTLVIHDNSNAQYKIRLTGIDAPERGQAYETKSKDSLNK